MNIYEKSLNLINTFYNVQTPEEIFNVLKSIINFESGYIFYTNPEKLEYAYNGKTNKICNLKLPYFCENLMYKNTVFGKLILEGESFTDEEKFIFKSLVPVISNIVKDNEISKIVKLQMEALQDGYEKILDAEKVKTKFLSHVSHELRTPLNSILGFSDLLTQEFTGKLNVKQKEYINDIKISGIHLLEMINEILDMSKIEANAISLNVSEFEILPAISEVLNIVKPLFLRKNITVENKVQDIKIHADNQKFQQIMFNLLSNAIKFTPQNGYIVIDGYCKDKKFIFSVADNGIGIEAKYHEKIFEKFEQVGDIHQGSTGLGLSITKELVKLHNGKIHVESEPNKGAKFIVELHA